MYTDYNPFFVGWSHAVDERSTNSRSDEALSHAPSIFGALPSPSSHHPSPSKVVTLHLTFFNPTILNCTVVGPESLPWFYIVTEANRDDRTVVRNPRGGSVAHIEWRGRPSIEIDGIVPKQGIRNWLKLSADRSFRSMEVKGVKYLWTPREKFIDLYTACPLPQEHLGRVSRETGTIRLDVTNYAIELGLLNATVLAALLLQCGRNID